MSGTESADEDSRTVTVEEDGVRIEKSLTLEEFDTPAIVFKMASDRDSVTYLKITDPLPDEIDPDDVGLHPEYDSEGWRRRGGDLQFEGRLAPDEDIETVYGLRVTNVDQPAALLAAPEIDDVVDATDEGESDDEETEDDDTSLDLDIGDDDEDDGGIDLDLGGDDEPEDEAAADTEADPAPSVDDDPEDNDTGPTVDTTGEATAEATGSTTETDAAGSTAETDAAGSETETDAAGPAVDADTVAAALVTELEEGRVDDETRAALNEHLQPTLPTSAETRLDRVQARLDDLEAYTDALERILDRGGDDDDVVSELESLRGEVSDLEGRTDDLGDDVAFNDARLEPLVDLDEDVATLREDVTAVEDDLETVREEVREDLSEDLDEIRDQIEDIQEWRDTLASTLAGGEE